MKGRFHRPAVEKYSKIPAELYDMSNLPIDEKFPETMIEGQSGPYIQSMTPIRDSEGRYRMMQSDLKTIDSNE